MPGMGVFLLLEKLTVRHLYYSFIRPAQFRVGRHYKASRLHDETLVPFHEDDMNVIESIRAGFSRQSREIYDSPKKNPMSEAAAEKFLWEMMLTEKWDHLFHQAWFLVEGLQFGYIPPWRKSQIQTIFSARKFPRILSPEFVVRGVSPYREPQLGFRSFQFIGKDRNDHVTVILRGGGEQWKPTGFRVVFLGKDRTSDELLITDSLPIFPAI